MAGTAVLQPFASGRASSHGFSDNGRGHCSSSSTCAAAASAANGAEGTEI